MSEALDTYRRVAGAFDAVVSSVAAGSWDAQSPCEEWKARDVVAHVVTGHRGVIAAMAGGEARPMGGDEDPVQAWKEVTRTLDGLAGDPEALAREVDGPAGRMPAGRVIGGLVSMDLMVHTWDLARAVGGDVTLDEATVRAAYETLRPMDADIRRPGVFGPRLEPPTGADLQTEFLAFVGRRA